MDETQSVECMTKFHIGSVHGYFCHAAQQCTKSLSYFFRELIQLFFCLCCKILRSLNWPWRHSGDHYEIWSWSVPDEHVSLWSMVFQLHDYGMSWVVCQKRGRSWIIGCQSGVLVKTLNKTYSIKMLRQKLCFLFYFLNWPGCNHIQESSLAYPGYCQ